RICSERRVAGKQDDDNCSRPSRHVHFNHGCAQASGESTMARRRSFCLNVMLAVPSIVRSLSSATFIGPGDGALPGAGCGNAVERAVWKVTLPSTFCIT